MATDVLTLKFKGVDEVTPATNKINTGLSDLGKTASNVAKGAMAAVAVGAAAIAAELYVSAKAAMEAEENMARLKKALENSGQATKKNLDALVLQSAELQNTTKYSDDAIQSLQALALNLGASADETKLITQASIDMAAALGTDAEGAAKALSLSLQGNSTALGKLIPEVKTMTDEQLAHGAAIELVAKKYRGFADNEGATLAGTLARLSNAFGDIQEEIGAIFTENEGLKSTLAGLVPILDDIKSLVIENKDGMRDFVTYGITLAVNGMATLAEGGVVLVDTLFALMEGYKRAAIALDEFNQKITPWETSGISDRIAEAKTELAGIVQMRAQFGETGTKIFGIAEAAKELAEQAGKNNYVQKETSIVFDEVTVKADRYSDRMAQMTKQTKEVAAATWDYTDAMNEQAAMMDFVNSQSLQSIGANAQQGAAGALPNGGALTGMANAVGAGSLSSTISAALTAMVPGIGGAIASALGPVMDLIITGNKQKMDEFFRGIATQVTNLATHIDDFVMSLVQNADEIIVAIAMLPTTLVTELATALPSLISGMATGIWDTAKGLFTGVVDTFKSIGDEIGGWFAADAESRRLSYLEQASLMEGLMNSFMGAGFDTGQRAQILRDIDAAAAKNAEDVAYLRSRGVNVDIFDEAQANAYAPRAFGGPVTAGQSYIVGDGQDGSMRNAEVFTPSRSGTITPKGDGGATNVSITIQAADNPHQNAQMVLNAFKYLVDTKKVRFDPIRNMAVA